MAEREGFEPSVPLLTAHTISSRAPSASSDISPYFSRVTNPHRGGYIMFLRILINEYVEIFFHPKVSMNTGIIFSKQLQYIKLKISFLIPLDEPIGTTDKMP
jgi:hypothetical protein